MILMICMIGPRCEAREECGDCCIGHVKSDPSRRGRVYPKETVACAVQQLVFVFGDWRTFSRHRWRTHNSFYVVLFVNAIGIDRRRQGC